MARFVSNVKSEMHGRRTKQQEETPVDRAARRTANATVWLAVFTVVLAATSVGTIWILKNQLREMHEGGIDTHALADATEKMKSSAEKSAQASRDFADTETKISSGIMSAAQELDRQAKELELARQDSVRGSNQALESAINNFHLDQRAWVGFVEMKGDIKGEELFIPIAYFMNSGRTPTIQ
jgi:hypothetical protein